MILRLLFLAIGLIALYRLYKYLYKLWRESEVKDKVDEAKQTDKSYQQAKDIDVDKVKSQKKKISKKTNF